VETSGLTRQRLLDAVHKAGHKLSDRQLTDWVSRGLIANATIIGKGKGKGVEGRWHPAQRDLLINLLAKRQTLMTLVPLYNIPVFIWLHWSDFNSYVLVDQVRKALGSWIAPSRTARSVSAARQAAEATVEQAAAPNTDKRDRRAAVRFLTDLATSAPVDPKALGEVIDAIGSQLPNRDIAELTSSRCRAIASYDTHTDEDFQRAREAYIEDVGGHIGSARDNGALQELADNACLNLLTHLGREDTAGG